MAWQSIHYKGVTASLTRYFYVVQALQEQTVNMISALLQSPLQATFTLIRMNDIPVERPGSEDLLSPSRF